MQVPMCTAWSRVRSAWSQYLIFLFFSPLHFARRKLFLRRQSDTPQTRVQTFHILLLSHKRTMIFWLCTNSKKGVQYVTTSRDLHWIRKRTGQRRRLPAWYHMVILICYLKGLPLSLSRLGCQSFFVYVCIFLTRLNHVMWQGLHTSG